MSLIHDNRFRNLTRYSSGTNRPKRSRSRSSDLPRDSVSLRGSSEAEKPRDVKKMALMGGLGVALGAAAAALLFPAAGLGALLLTATVGGVGGAAIADGALETAGTKPAEPFDPYDMSDVLDPNKLFHPLHPYNPANMVE